LGPSGGENWRRSVLPTWEVRWFLRGKVPAEVEAWFRQAGSALAPVARRVDHYLRLPGEDSWGIKLREGRLEVKERQGSGKVATLHQLVAGRLEHWRKYGLAVAPGGSDLTGRLAGSDSWVAVEKARLLRRYRVTSGGAVVPASSIEYPDRACDWELTQVCMEGKIWWTVGFEASGREPDLEQTLQRVVAQVLAEQVPPTLKTQNSFGYPQWLALFDRRRL
jgi:hypothetical protein